YHRHPYSTGQSHPTRPSPKRLTFALSDDSFKSVWASRVPQHYVRSSSFPKVFSPHHFPHTDCPCRSDQSTTHSPVSLGVADTPSRLTRHTLAGMPVFERSVSDVR